MKIQLLALTAALGLAVTAKAENALETLRKAGGGLETAAAEVPAPDLKASSAGLLGSVMTAMYDQPGTGEKLVEWLRANKASVEFRETGLENSAHAWTAGKMPAVYISPAAKEPVSYRYLGALIARETAELMLLDFPESAEKRYMVASRMGETYFELGGTRAEMDGLDGHPDAKAAESIRLWVENDPAGGAAVLKQRGFKTLKDLETELFAAYERLMRLVQAIDQMLVVPNDPNAPSLREELERTRAEASAVAVKLAAVRAGMAQYSEFSKEESAWFWEHQGALQ